MLITFSGLEGAGKTTLIGLLKPSLERRGVRVRVSHMYRDVGLLAIGRAALRRLGRGRDGAAGGPARGAPAGPAGGLVWNGTLRSFVYPLDLLIFVLYRAYVERVRGNVLIMDRYFYDTLADLGAAGRPRVARLLARLTPTPSVPVLLDISPAEAFARKGEHTISFLEPRREVYRRVFPNGGRGLVLEAGREPGENLRAVESAVLERMNA
ncbi:MAG TPA: hypothetical protein VG148_07290 [Pyrinomonadaceae bacterium]|nr:hypothetical protein [Pyrinomonadaceae bacterium]